MTLLDQLFQLNTRPFNSKAPALYTSEDALESSLYEHAVREIKKHMETLRAGDRVRYIIEKSPATIYEGVIRTKQSGLIFIKDASVARGTTRFAESLDNPPPATSLSDFQ